MGLHFALRAKPAWRRFSHLLLAVAVVLPLTAAMGFVSMGREFQWTGVPPTALPTAEQGKALGAAENAIKWGYGLALVALLAARWGRNGLARWSRQPRSSSARASLLVAGSGSWNIGGRPRSA